MLAAQSAQNRTMDNYASPSMVPADSLGPFHESDPVCPPALSLRIPPSMPIMNLDYADSTCSPDFYAASSPGTDFMGVNAYALSPDPGLVSPMPFDSEALFANSPEPLRRRDDSFPVMGSFSTSDRAQFPASAPGTQFSAIPTIEVTSYDTFHSENLSPVDFRYDLAFDLPDLSTGDYSGPPSIALSEYSFNSNVEDNFLSGFGANSMPISRRTSVAFSDFSDNSESFEFPKPKPNRMRSTSDVFPVSQRSQNHLRSHSATPAPPNLEDIRSQTPSRPIRTNIEETFSRAFFSTIHPFFPISTREIFTSALLATQSASLSSTTAFTTHPNRAATDACVLLILAIGAAIHSLQSQDIAERYYTRAMQKYHFSSWETAEGIQAAILLCIYSIISDKEKARHNVWMINANIAAAVIDLGLHLSVSGGKDADGEAERNLLTAVYVLDRTVAVVKERPFALHDCDLESGILKGVREEVRRRAGRIGEIAEGMNGNANGKGWRKVLRWLRQVDEEL
jgi:hypothetical protein